MEVKQMVIVVAFFMIIAWLSLVIFGLLSDKKHDRVRLDSSAVILMIAPALLGLLIALGSYNIMTTAGVWLLW